MSITNDDHARFIERKRQAEVAAHRTFIKMATRLSKVAYGIVSVSPDPADPLKKAIGHYKGAWLPITFHLRLREVVGRRSYGTDYYDRYRWEPSVVARYIGTDGCYSAMTLSKLGPRCVKKILTQLNVFHENVCATAKQLNELHDEEVKKAQLLNATIAKISGVRKVNDEWKLGEFSIGESYANDIKVRSDGTVVLPRIRCTTDDVNKLGSIIDWNRVQIG